MVIQNYFNFENAFFVVHFMLDSTVALLGHPVYTDYPTNKNEIWRLIPR